MAFVKKFYIADTHFCHERIVGMCARPFADITEHDEELIRRWNAVVGADDIIYHLGDFAARLQDVERVRGIFHRLNGRKYLIQGNHDLDKKGRLHKTLAGLTWAERPVAATEVGDGGKRIYLSHYAMRAWPAQHHGSFHFYGHSHGKLAGVGLSRDVGVDLSDVDFTPRTFAELTANMELEPT